MTINSYDRDILSKLEDKVYDGKIDYNKLRSGEEVILVMPKKAELMVRLYHNGMGSHYNYDDDVGKPKNLYKTVMTETVRTRQAMKLRCIHQRTRRLRRLG